MHVVGSSCSHFLSSTENTTLLWWSIWLPDAGTPILHTLIHRAMTDFKFQRSRFYNNLNSLEFMEKHLHFNHIWTNPFMKSSGETTCSPVSHPNKFLWFFCMTIHRNCIYTCHSHTAYSVRYASCGLAWAFKRYWHTRWVPSYTNVKGANKIKYGSPLSVWYQSIVPRSKIQLVS